MKIRVKIKPNLDQSVEVNATDWYIVRIFSVDQLLLLWDKFRVQGFLWLPGQDINQGGGYLTAIAHLFKNGGAAYVTINARTTNAEGKETIHNKKMGLHSYPDGPARLKDDLIPLSITQILENSIHFI